MKKPKLDTTDRGPRDPLMMTVKSLDLGLCKVEDALTPFRSIDWLRAESSGIGTVAFDLGGIRFQLTCEQTQDLQRWLNYRYAQNELWREGWK